MLKASRNTDIKGGRRSILMGDTHVKHLKATKGWNDTRYETRDGKAVVVRQRFCSCGTKLGPEKVTDDE